MTTEQAIKLLHRLQDEQFDGPHGDERREALEMAVKALEGDGDTISRQATIDEVINLWADKPFGNPTLVEIKDCIVAKTGYMIHSPEEGLGMRGESDV